MKAIARSDDLRRENQRRVLSALLAASPMSRTGLAAATGLSASTVTAVTSDLLDAGHLVEADSSGPQDMPRRGRPQVALARNPDAASIAVLTVTVNELAGVLVDYAGGAICTRQVRTDTNALGRRSFVQALADLLEDLLALAPAGSGRLSAIEVSVQGVVDAGGRVIHWSPLSPHRDINVAAELSGVFGVNVSVANDTNMIATGLRSRAPDRFSDTFAAIMLSYGIGMGLYLNGRLFGGARTSGAEFGHMHHDAGDALCRCGRTGCVEAYASEYGIYRMATGLPLDVMPDIEPSQETMARIAAAALAGEPRAQAAYAVAGRALGGGLLNLFAIFDPIPVAFVGSGTMAFDLMEPIIRQTLGDPGPGLPCGGVPMYCYPDNLDLMSHGTVITGLSGLDQQIAIGAGAA